MMTLQHTLNVQWSLSLADRLSTLPFLTTLIDFNSSEDTYKRQVQTCLGIALPGTHRDHAPCVMCEPSYRVVLHMLCASYLTASYCICHVRAILPNHYAYVMCQLTGSLLHAGSLCMHRYDAMSAYELFRMTGVSTAVGVYAQTKTGSTH
jgi:hypothetical protein